MVFFLAETSESTDKPEVSKNPSVLKYCVLFGLILCLIASAVAFFVFKSKKKGKKKPKHSEQTLVEKTNKDQKTNNPEVINVSNSNVKAETQSCKGSKVEKKLKHNASEQKEKDSPAKNKEDQEDNNQAPADGLPEGLPDGEKGSQKKPEEVAELTKDKEEKLKLFEQIEKIFKEMQLKQPEKKEAIEATKQKAQSLESTLIEMNLTVDKIQIGKHQSYFDITISGYFLEKKEIFYSLSVEISKKTLTGSSQFSAKIEKKGFRFLEGMKIENESQVEFKKRLKEIISAVKKDLDNYLRLEILYSDTLNNFFTKEQLEKARIVSEIEIEKKKEKEKEILKQKICEKREEKREEKEKEKEIFIDFEKNKALFKRTIEAILFFLLIFQQDFPENSISEEDLQKKELKIIKKDYFVLLSEQGFLYLNILFFFEIDGIKKILMRISIDNNYIEIVNEQMHRSVYSAAPLIL